MEKKIKSRNNSGLTIVELVVAIAIVGILALFVAPQIGLMRSNYNVRSCATDLIQNIRTARAMAIKENGEYIIVFNLAGQMYSIGYDDDGDNDLVSATDGYGDCVGVACIRQVTVSQCGNGIQFGTQAPNGPDNDGDGTFDALCANGSICFGNNELTFAIANATGSYMGNANNYVYSPGYVYLTQTTRDYSYVVALNNVAGSTNMWKWDGDENNLLVTTWTEIR